MQRMNIPRQRVDFAVVCDPVERQWDDARQRYGLDTFTPDYREVLADPEIELVLVLTSMQQHGEIARAALEAGKHVLVEKPMAMTLPEAAELVELAERSPGYLVCAPHVVLSPTYQAIWQRLQRGAIGTVLSARGFYGWSVRAGAMVLSTRRRADVRPRRLQRDHPDRSARSGAAGDGHERHRHPGAGGR